MVNVVKYSTGDHISLIDGNDVVIAHGVMMDDEPDVEELFKETGRVHESSRIPGHWCIIAITDVVRGCGKLVIDAGHAFWPNGQDMNAQERTIQAIFEECVDNGFIIFHQWIVPRRRHFKKKPKSRASAAPSKKQRR
jgi:hypothetical protein